MRLIRLALQAVLFFLVLGAVIGIADAETGPAEKLVFALVAAALIGLGAPVRRIG